MEEKTITILGAGLVGSLLSLLLAQHGQRVSVYEKRADPRKSGPEQGRSINLALSRRGLRALEAAGIGSEISRLTLPMTGRMMHNATGKLTFQPYGKEGQEIYSVSRAQLNELLMDKAENAGVNIHFNSRCEEVDLANTTVSVANEQGLDIVKAELIFGTDGAFSAVREAMRKTDRYNYSQFYIDHGYKELSIPPTKTGEFTLPSNALHIWPRGQFMLIALPNLDKSFTVTLFLPFQGEKSFEQLNNEQKVKAFFTEQFPDAVAKMPGLVEDFFNNPVGSLVTIDCFPWVKHDKIAILGDAAHAIVPFYGQGMNAGFEDCRILNELIREGRNDWPAILNSFQSLRKPDADAISTLALQNFIEMRDLVADDKFLLQKKIEAKIHEQNPDLWVPLYSMVTFSDMRYSEALKRGKEQEAIMDKIMKTPGIEENWQEMDFSELLKREIRA